MRHPLVPLGFIMDAANPSLTNIRKRSMVPSPWLFLSNTSFPQPLGWSSHVHPLLHTMNPTMMMWRWGGGWGVDIVRLDHPIWMLGSVWCMCCVLMCMWDLALEGISQQLLGPCGSHTHGHIAPDEDNLFVQQFDSSHPVNIGKKQMYTNLSRWFLWCGGSYNRVCMFVQFSPGNCAGELETRLSKHRMRLRTLPNIHSKKDKKDKSPSFGALIKWQWDGIHHKTRNTNHKCSKIHSGGTVILVQISIFNTVKKMVSCQFSLFPYCMVCYVFSPALALCCGLITFKRWNSPLNAHLYIASSMLHHLHIASSPLPPLSPSTSHSYLCNDGDCCIGFGMFQKRRSWRRNEECVCPPTCFDLEVILHVNCNYKDFIFNG